MDNGKEEEASPKLPEGTVLYRPQEEVYERLHLCIYMRELLDNQPSDAEATEPEKPGKD